MRNGYLWLVFTGMDGCYIKEDIIEYYNVIDK